ncbi:hypothetical protein, unlikely [Trypanosoma brucei gambiense DAL972]|uniref:Uncharacterized protein n=1 Tax=Trypanosoma brucei gambiense (strain MHOM/CI/86/DAL972) TaxID=679716 RepID=C9ZZW9_TRYB9|nr:hypothetical protein, unlikely [Trypanosoma brucei gambiense DAL972]CBH16527.1 hypothetical protein, unlikely [Trypanosoma brucei gambiense DAL972]|eukprot:XP_011778791.1 hypothetical protein, unlikely [Trypanosoma brucei gambiense DAL972]
MTPSLTGYHRCINDAERSSCSALNLRVNPQCSYDHRLPPYILPIFYSVPACKYRDKQFFPLLTLKKNLYHLHIYPRHKMTQFLSFIFSLFFFLTSLPPAPSQHSIETTDGTPVLATRRRKLGYPLNTFEC